jgi:hypothetical protein
MVISNTQKIKVLQKYFGKGLQGKDGGILFTCPACNETRRDKKKLVVQLDNGWYHCWVCGLSGKSLFTLFKKTFPKSLSDPECSSIFERQESFTNAHEEKIEKVELPEGAILVGLDESKDPDVQAVKKYLSDRGLTKGDMLRWRICAVKSGKLKRKAIIPSFDEEGNLNFYSARAIDETKYKYINASCHKTEIIFNDVDIDWSKPILLVEGIFDAIKCPENTIPVLGSELSKKSFLFKKLWQNNCKVTVAFDPDLKEKSHKVCSLLSSAGLEVYQVWAPPDKDFGCMKKQEVEEILKNSKPWYKEYHLSFKIGNITSGSML